MNFLSGYKTYIAGFGLIVQGVVGLAMHFADSASPLALPLDQAFAIILNGLGLAGLRKAVTPPKA